MDNDNSYEKTDPQHRQPQESRCLRQSGQQPTKPTLAMNPLPLQIRFNDIDQMGHVNNAVIMEFFDLGKDHFFRSHGLPPEEGDFTVMVVHYEVDFRSQIHKSDRIAVETAVERFGSKSLTVMQRIVEEGTGRVCAECRTVMAGYRRSIGASDVIPDEVKAQLAS